LEAQLIGERRPLIEVERVALLQRMDRVMTLV